MLRVISGKFKGKKFKEPVDFNVSRPTMDRIKESMFDILQYRIKDAKVLDLFSGSGALGIEALSRGAKSCTFVDSNEGAVKLINENLKLVGAIGDVVLQDYEKVLSNLASKGVKKDVVLLDPPYNTKLGIEAIKIIKGKNLLSSQGIIVFETDQNFFLECLEIFPNSTLRKYGKKNLIFLEND